jgi:hypothetical protein
MVDHGGQASRLSPTGPRRPADSVEGDGRSLAEVVATEPTAFSVLSAVARDGSSAARNPRIAGGADARSDENVNISRGNAMHKRRLASAVSQFASVSRVRPP